MSTDNFIDYYVLLDVPVSASKQEIKNKYNTIKDKTDKIKTAYETLIDENERKAYDKIYAQKRLAKSNKVDEEQEKNLIEETKNHFDVINDFITEQLVNKDLELSVRTQLADQAEKLYRQNMWPLLEKVKKISGENSDTYIFICKLHSKTLFSLGELCMWANSFKRAIGMYNTALALACEDEELVLTCNQALEVARVAYETSRVAKKGLASTKISKKTDDMYISYTQMLLWIFCGFFFASACFWIIVLLWDSIFDR